MPAGAPAPAGLERVGHGPEEDVPLGQVPGRQRQATTRRQDPGELGDGALGAAQVKDGEVARGLRRTRRPEAAGRGRRPAGTRSLAAGAGRSPPWRRRCRCRPRRNHGRRPQQQQHDRDRSPRPAPWSRGPPGRRRAARRSCARRGGGRTRRNSRFAAPMRRPRTPQRRRWSIGPSLTPTRIAEAPGIRTLSLAARAGAASWTPQRVTTRSASAIRRATSGGATHSPPRPASCSSVAPRATAQPFQT